MSTTDLRSSSKEVCSIGWKNQYSPDLNPIENLWADLARRVEQFQCETMLKLQDIVAEQWKETDKQLLRTLARSMPERCQAVIDAHGDHTSF